MSSADPLGEDAARLSDIAAAARADDGPRTPPPSRKEPTSGGALADALRRAGVTAVKNGTNHTKPR